MSIVYKQRYAPLRDAATPGHNKRHLIYIATRPGIIPNPGCGFCLWGRMGEKEKSFNINSLREAKQIIGEASREHTVYRAVVSLDEETAIRKELHDRDAWQPLISSHMHAVAKENDIALKDLRWCASYHQEKGHPHAHVMFWDNSSRVRAEGMSHERFEIAAEKIRAAFNKDIFREELRTLRAEQDASKKQLRALSRNHVEGFDALAFFEDDSAAQAEPEARFYPKYLRQSDADALSRRLEELLYLLPVSGQIKYQLLPPNVKAAVNEVSRLVMNNDAVADTRASLLRSVEQIAKTYGNSEASVTRQVARAEKELFKEIGNEVLGAIKQLRWLEHRNESRADALREDAHDRAIQAAFAAIERKTADAAFSAMLHQAAAIFPKFVTPRQEVLKDCAVTKALRSLTLACMADEELKNAIRISQAFQSQIERGDKTSRNPPEHNETDHNDDPKESASGSQGDMPLESPANEEADQKEDSAAQKDSTKEAASEFKDMYRLIYNQMFNLVAEENGWDAQDHILLANSFLHAFCKMTRNRSARSDSRFLALRDLSRQARKERANATKDSSKSWDSLTMF